MVKFNSKGIKAFLLTVIVQFLALNLLLNSVAKSNEKYRPSHPSQLPLGTKVDIGYRIKTAKVVVFNRKALERDFVFLRGRSNLEIESWILDNFAYINAVQLQLSGIRNTEIQIDFHRSKKLYIPPGVGRGSDIAIDGHPGMVSVKANGNSSWNIENVTGMVRDAQVSPQMLLKVREMDHRSGLEPFFIAGAEYLRQLEIQEDYDVRNERDRDKSNYQTVESYFLLDLGFNVIYPNEEFRAYVYGRQSHFGRTAGNAPIANEIYKDKGLFQETYTKSRVDFGGARTKSESEIAFHESLKSLVSPSPQSVAEFMRAEEQKFLNLRAKVSKMPKPTLVSASSARIFLEGNFGKREISPMPAAIGLSSLDIMDKGWLIDLPDLALIKWTLFQLNGEALSTYLVQLGESALNNLFRYSKQNFQIPLPKAVYEFGLAHPGLQSYAIVSASKVFKIFPELVEPSLRIALAQLFANKSFWQPQEIASLIAVEEEFPGYEDFLLKVVESNCHGAKVDVIEKLWQQRENRQRSIKIINHLLQFERSSRVVGDARLRFPELVKTIKCQAVFAYD